ncbi:Proteasome subunit [Bacillus paranthracis]|uniref:hypothetical protein n=1 Tax=Bacillus cereus group TaxID=86661 RepID=UPI000A301FBB|nr:hypothetical protein [Bacillus paranthracis]MCR6791553.1 hypothetical protein [Bacillus paranthracis]MED1169540.1 hypothetical protein [Bacillus paranthracis]SME26481.1 Proteasome subunit [Bacillus paranthracis]
MTILIGYRLDNGVIFTADRRTSEIDKVGNNLGTSYNTSKKIIHIRPNIIISTAGLGTLGRTTAKLVRSLIFHKEDLSIDDALKITQECFSFVHHKFKQNNPDVTYDLMYVMFGGFDFDKNTSFLYELKSTDNFTINKNNNENLIVGSKQESVTAYISENIKHYTIDKFPELFSSAIRSIEADDVSKETQSVFSFVNNKEPYANEIFLDENGVRTTE